MMQGENTPGMVVHGYVRVSSDEQADSRLGLEAQREVITRACELKGYVLSGFYEDAGLTGSNTRRPALEAVLGRVQRAEGIIVAKLDRLSRSVHDFAGLIRVADKQGWAPVCLDPDLDLATPNGRLVANVLMAVSQWEAEIVGQRTKEALAAKKLRGEYVGGTPLIVGELAQEIHAMRARPMTYRAICAELEARGVPTPSGGARWRPSSLQGVLAR